MKKKVILFGLFISLLFGMNILAKSETFVKQDPEKPKKGDNVIITYNALASQAKLKNANEITLYLLCFDSQNDIKLEELKMSNVNNQWTIEFKLDQEVFFAYYFDDGTYQDFNQEEVWYSIVYDQKGQAVPKANYYLGMLLNNGGFMEFRMNQSKVRSKEYFDKEILTNPSYAASYFLRWNNLLREKPGNETEKLISKELDKVFALNKNNEKELFNLLQWYSKTGQKAKGEDIKNSLINKHPKGYIAQFSILEQIFNTSDLKARIELCRKALTDYPEMESIYKNNIYNVLISSLVDIKDYNQAEEILNSMNGKTSNLYNNIAWPLIEKGEQLDRAVKWANEGMKLAENPEIADKPPYYSTKSWKAQNEQSLGLISDTYAFGLFKLGYTMAAEKYYIKSYTIMKGSDEEVNARYVECLFTNGKYDDVVEVTEECLLNERSNESMIGNYKRAWLKLGRNEEEFNTKMAHLSSNAKIETDNKLKNELLNTTAIDFSLKSLDGKIVKLSELKGKIVVIDFWATWCGPCKVSFPALQKITDKYKDNPNIVILAVNTWEQVKGDERIAKVKEFIETNNYTFTVLFDEDVVNKYGVTGIPTKFIVDRYGKLQFKKIGFDGESKMINEMEAQFEMLLNDDYLNYLK